MCPAWMLWGMEPGPLLQQQQILVLSLMTRPAGALLEREKRVPLSRLARQSASFPAASRQNSSGNRLCAGPTGHNEQANVLFTAFFLVAFPS